MSASKITFSYFRFTLNTSVLVAWLVTTINCDYQNSAALTGGLSDLLGYFNTTSLIKLFKTRVTVLLLSLTVVCVLYTVYIIFKSVTLELKKQSKQKSNFACHVHVFCSARQELQFISVIIWIDYLYYIKECTNQIWFFVIPLLHTEADTVLQMSLRRRYSYSESR